MAPVAIPLIATLALLAALPAHALSCRPTPLRDARDEVHAKWSAATAVFVGRLASLVQVGKPRGVHAAGAIHDVHAATFEPLESFKGGTASIEAAAPADLRSGETYLVFVDLVDGTMRTRRDCALQPNGPLPLSDPRAAQTLATLRSLPRAGEGGVLFVKVHSERPLHGSPLFIEGPRGSRVVALDAEGVARVAGLPPGDYRLRLQGGPGVVQCLWSAQCEALRVVDREIAIAVMQLLRPTSVSSSS